MEKIKIFALGGLGENGKNMYCVEVGEDIIVLDVGFKYPDDSMYGIDTVVPDFEYLKVNRDRIKGLFLSHGHLDNMGAVDDFVNAFPNVKIYGSKTTLMMVKYFVPNTKEVYDNLVEINDFAKIDFNTCSVFAVPLTHSIPNHFGYAINTKQGIIFYATDYIFDQSVSDIYATDIGKLAYLGKQGVLCMLGESLNAPQSGHTSPHHRIDLQLQDFFEAAGKKAYVMLFSSNIYRIQEVLNESAANNRKVVVYGERLEDIVNKGIDFGIIEFDKNNLLSIFDVEKHEEDITIIVSGRRDRPFSGMDKIVSGRDKFLKVTSEDSVYIACTPVPGTEDDATRVTDAIYRSEASVSAVSKSVVRGNHASKEDIMLMMNLLKPKYFIPIKGEYRHQIAARDAVISMRFDEDNILLLDNGDVACFENKELSGTLKVPVGENLVDGKIFSEGEVILKDRELLKENGIVIVSAAINSNTRKLIAGPEILTRGFIYIKENQEYISQLKSFCKGIIDEHLSEKHFNYNDLRSELREKLSKHIYEEKGRNPMIITLIQTVNQ